MLASSICCIEPVATVVPFGERSVRGAPYRYARRGVRTNQPTWTSLPMPRVPVNPKPLK